MRECAICECYDKNIEHIQTIELRLVNDINLNSDSYLKYCNKCNFYF